MTRHRIAIGVVVFVAMLLIARSSLHAADNAWIYARIASVKKSVTTSTKAWVVNTPLDEERTQFAISVHLQDRIIVGKYEMSATQPEPPREWVAGYAVQMELSGDSMYLRSKSGSLRLRVTQSKTAGPMQPITAEEKKRLSELDAVPQSMIGFANPGEEKAAAVPEAAASAAPAPAPAMGTVMVRSTPFLAEVFVDGDSMGYTPAKIVLGPGKRLFRVEKPGYKAWVKETTVTEGSELTLDATLEKK